MDTRTIMIVEDDREIRALLADLLTREGYAPVCVENGAAMDRALMQACPDLIVLDIMLPGEDGLSICQRLRGKSRTPILMLTAKADDVDRIIGLELGADDYLPKPFNPRELLARIKAVLRRVDGPLQMPPPRRIAFGRLVADLDGRSLTNDQDRIVELTAAEFDLLACFLERPKRVLSRDQLLDWTRGRTADPFDRVIDVSVSRLRRKLVAADPKAAFSIRTVRNGGYLFSADVRPL
ncbi:response regulator [Bradyrhizobium canariense]|jgi:two-component system OmpR family response regulator|uniref:Regulatory protein VirG n=1 Tax=Bradyrhizobium canariense TaxID=255045 RepID=A0A1X3GH58_9BRAD|nr:response regulator [Bradyrhizobium canariense]OSI25248.1 DNA-binding response regulator [Bradyrhizobium canariense]OSI28579.1 DNA-binding response regulator [Bradyrhizobium canariense]OSI40759.1 DNA-binding response regulator [Bradyrhizobium canariense]OSI48940.1 DNA-binding response regulator [Bradyrhizobium canariense]OSI56444.1 DNA-binding response regulator [Bradyrhizobium canariense]